MPIPDTIWRKAKFAFNPKQPFFLGTCVALVVFLVLDALTVVRHWPELMPDLLPFVLFTAVFLLAHERLHKFGATLCGVPATIEGSVTVYYDFPMTKKDLAIAAAFPLTTFLIISAISLPILRAQFHIGDVSLWFLVVGSIFGMAASDVGQLIRLIGAQKDMIVLETRTPRRCMWLAPVPHYQPSPAPVDLESSDIKPGPH